MKPIRFRYGNVNAPKNRKQPVDFIVNHIELQDVETNENVGGVIYVTVTGRINAGTQLPQTDWDPKKIWIDDSGINLSLHLKIKALIVKQKTLLVY